MTLPPASRKTIDPRPFIQEEQDLETRIQALFSSLRQGTTLTDALNTAVSTTQTTVSAIDTRVATLESAPGPTVPSPLTIITSTQGTAYRLTKSGGGGGLQVVVSSVLFNAANPITWVYPAVFASVPTVLSMVLAGSINIVQAENVTVGQAELRRWEWNPSPASWGSGASYSVLAVAIGTW